MQFDWKSVLNYLIVVVFARYIIPWLKKHGEAADAMAAKNNIDAKGMLTAHLESFLCTVAANIGEKRFPDLAKKVQSGELTTAGDIKAELQKWGTDLKAFAIQHFADQDVDVVAELGEKAIERLIESAANKVSPFPGMETAETLLKNGVAQAILDKGVEFVKEKASEIGCKACVPPCDTCPLKQSNTAG